jgi:hypothetical protein
MTRLSSHLIIVGLSFLVASPIMTTAERPDRLPFLHRRGPSAAFQTSFSKAEMDALNCNSVDDDDSEARFAIQYQMERESMRRTESGYLLLQQEVRQSGARTVVPVSAKKSSISSTHAFVIA